MTKLQPIKSGLALGALLSALLAVTTARAGLQIPYTADSTTRHLWHLDEASGSTAADAVSLNPITLTNIGLPTPATPPFTNTTLGTASFAGQGQCMSGTSKSHLLYGGTFPDVSQFSDTNTGAFTFEALVKFNINPLGAIDAEIVAGDNGAGIGGRGWQWRIFNGVMEWDLLAGSTDNDFKMALPATGADAAIVGAWYHVAVTYTGNSPTNGDTANLITFYWTLLDANRIAADQLAQFTATRPLSGSPEGAATPNLGIGGSGRTTAGTNPGNGEGIIGSIDEIRISSVARHANQMAFVTGGALNPPSFTQQPPVNTLVGYGQLLTVPALVSGTPPLSYQWQLSNLNVSGQTDTTLVISNATFTNGGSYQLIVTNAYGSRTSAVAQVTIGSTPEGLADTGLDTNGLVSVGDVIDPNWTLFNSADLNNLGPNLFIFEASNPIQFASPNGAFSPSNGISQWTGVGGNLGGNPPSSPAGLYYYRATFLVDSADPATVTASGNLWANGTISDILVNGKSSGITLNPGGTLYVIPYAVTNGFVQGVNTLDFVENLTAAGPAAIRVEVHAVGQALPAGLPVITNQPANQVVRDSGVLSGSQATFAVTALGRPPLTYQWLADGSPLAGATNRILTFINPTAGAQGTNFSVIVSNGSGAILSHLASLTLVSSNQPPVPFTFSSVVFASQTYTLPLSRIVQMSADPDGDLISFISADGASTNGNANGVGNVNQVGAALVYTPVAGAIGADQFNYVISDAPGATSQGAVDILNLLQPADQVVSVGDTATFDVGLSNALSGYALQWQHNGTNITGATSRQLTVANAQIADAGGYALVVTDPLNQLWPSPVAGLTVGTLGSGTGLTGDYYGNVTNGFGNFAGAPTLTRLDPTVDFNWTSASPDPSLPQAYFMARWHGQVEPLYSDTYTFSTTSDDGSRLWVNGQLLANQWQAQGAATAGGSITLTAHQKYDIVMEYFQQTGPAVAQLSWSSPHQAQQIIPMTQLYPGAGLPQPALKTTFGGGTSLNLNWSGTFSVQSATNVQGPWSTVATNVVSPYPVPIGSGQKAFYRLVDPVGP